MKECKCDTCGHYFLGDGSTSTCYHCTKTEQDDRRDKFLLKLEDSDIEDRVSFLESWMYDHHMKHLNSDIEDAIKQENKN